MNDRLDAAPTIKPDQNPWLSVIVPVWNECENLEQLARQLLPLQQQGCELLLVDGFSPDGSYERARQMGLPIIQAGKGRAAQMNAGAAHTSAPVLLFLHADTLLPESAVDDISDALFPSLHGVSNLNSPRWGRFDVYISADGTKRPKMFHVIGAMINLRSRFSRISTGDQGQFFVRQLFNEVGGFPDQPLMEDIEISLRLRKRHVPACISKQVKTSGRRWLVRGVWPTIFLMWRLRWAYWRGASAQSLAELYK